MKKNLFFLLFFLIITQIRAQADCVSALGVCGNSAINYAPVGIGNINENVGGCLSGEHNSVWYKFTIATSGTLTFDIIPASQDTDYDWAVFGPNVTCANFGSPIRCNAATVVGVGANTGLDMTSTNTVGAPGSTTPYCRYMDVVAGETYYLYIDNWVSSTSSSMSAFTLNWGGTATLASPFTDPALQPRPFLPPGNPAANPSNPREIVICASPAIFDFSTLTSSILNNNPNFVISYHTSQNDALSGINPITAPQLVNTTTVYYYSIHYSDPANANNPINSCRQIGAFKFILGSITGNNVTIYACNNNNNGVGSFNLATAAVFGDPTATKRYFATLNDLNANVNEITNFTNYTSAEGKVYVKITTTLGCVAIAEITLKFRPIVTVNDAVLRSCAIETAPTTGTFDLSTASVTTVASAVKKYYPSLTDAINGTNEILSFTNYISPTGFVYIKVFNAEGCYAVAKVSLNVIPQTYSKELKDKIICAGDTTILDAGTGFDGYEWSTGSTSQTTSAGIGTYWVRLRNGNCYTMQTVKVFASEQPVIYSVDVSNTTITINVKGGKAPYQYSLDNIHWQDSNVFTGLSRGDHTIYVKDAYNCQPIMLNIVVPNLINAITPNGDGINDYIDYSALSNKRNLEFNVYNRYGNLVFKADKFNDYKWDGTSNGKKISTGNYWYTIKWNENTEKNTPITYSGWVIVKNRE